MFYIIYKNDLGELKFSGDGSSPLSLTQITGLGTPEKIYQTREYLDSDGQSTVSSRFAPRTITLAFDLKGDDISYQTANLYRILSHEGVLSVFSGSSERCTQVSQVSVDSFFRHGSFYRSFTAQFICDCPYFCDTMPIYLPCYEITKNLRYDSENESWHLDTPTIWGANNNDMLFINSGHIKTFPTFTVYSSGNAQDSSGFEILRVNPQNPNEIIQRFALNYALSDGETVTICFDPRSEKKRRYISSSLGTNLLNFRSEDCSLAEFYFDCGKNRLIINNLSEGNSLTAYISYNNHYIEGVF